MFLIVGFHEVQKVTFVLNMLFDEKIFLITKILIFKSKFNMNLKKIVQIKTRIIFNIF